MVRRVLAHPLFGPGLAIAAFGWGSLVVLFLIVGPGLSPWTDTLLRACFGWNAETRRYRLDTLILARLQPPLFVGVLALFYADELRAFDPERDTPAALAAHALRWGLGRRWHLLTGEAAAVRRLVAAYGVQWTRFPDGEIAHENVVVLLDRAGRVAFTYRGLAHPEARAAADLARLVREHG